MPWSPWNELDAQPDIALLVAELPAGFHAICAIDGSARAIVLGSHLAPVERDAALAHELVHLERGGGLHRPDAPAGWRAVVAREERRVDAIVAERLVPEPELSRLVSQRAEVEPVTAALVAAEFQVPEAVARRALEELSRRTPGREEEPG